MPAWRGLQSVASADIAQAIARDFLGVLRERAARPPNAGDAARSGHRRGLRRACRDELEAPKPGNVHVFAEGHAMTVEDFRLAARNAAPFIAARGARIGERISRAV